MTFWKRLEQILIEKDMTEAELSRQIGYSQAGINGWKTKGNIPIADVAVKVAKLLGTTVEYLILGDNPVEFRDVKNKNVFNLSEKNYFLVPVLNQELSAGKGDFLPDSDTVTGLVPVPSELGRFGEKLAALYVHGDSMEPTLHNGELVLCDSCGWDNGEGLYAIRLNGMGYIKRIQVGAGKIRILSDNPKYEPIEEPIGSDAFSVIGRVRYSLTRY
ncbi:MAG: helix-turn-helix transcriptional regulator [Treponema sp.]|nr:helix-turn-helix transcriptional regulator [Treponema sp.]